jgi:hypothetical protein
LIAAPRSSKSEVRSRSNTDEPLSEYLRSKKGKEEGGCVRQGASRGSCEGRSRSGRGGGRCW